MSEIWHNFKPNRKRDKKFVLCGHAFYDHSWAASAKYCGNKCQQRANTVKTAARKKAMR